MKKLQTETSTTGRAPANVHDQSGVLLGTATADWDNYRLWASGPSDTVEAGRVLSAEDIARLGLADDSSVFLLDAPNDAEPERKTILTLERPVGHLPFGYCLVSENVDDRTDYEILEEGRIDLRKDGNSERLDALREQADEIWECDNLVARDGKSRVR